MIFEKMQPTGEKNISVCDFSDGINLNCEKAAIKKCVNLELSSGSLQTRKSLKLPKTAALYNENYTGDGITVDIASQNFSMNGVRYKMAVIRESDEAIYVKYSFRLLNENAGFTSLGYIEFTPVTSTEFNTPESVFVFAGEKTVGSGIYAVFSIYNNSVSDERQRYSMRVFEYQASSSEWVRINDNYMYVPLYYRNGRGVHYGKSDLKYPEPEFPEAINMLSPRFKCQFSADGMSDVFFLPVNDLQSSLGDGIACYVEVENGEKLSFVVNGTSALSNELTYNENTVKLSFDRLTGKLQFIGFVPPDIGKINNIEVSVCKHKCENTKKISHMNSAMWYNAGNSGACLCVSGNSLYPSLLCISAVNNPFYFPEDNCFFLGDPTQKITALARQNKSLVVFKENEMYCGIYSSGKFSISHLHSAIGCDLPRTVALCGNRIVWATTGKKIYTLNSISDYGAVAVYCISKKINEQLQNENLSDANAVFQDDRYMLFFGNKAYVMDLSGALIQSNREFLQAAAFTQFELPSDMSVEAVYSGKAGAIIIGRTFDLSKEYRKVLFLGSISGDSGADEILLIDDGEEEKAERPFECCAEFCCGIIPSAVNKMFNKLYINSYAENGLCIDYISASGDIVKSANIDMKYTQMKYPVPYRLIPLVCSKSFSFAVRAKGRMKVSGYTLYFREFI